jgi:hypothetical protein
MCLQVFQGNGLTATSYLQAELRSLEGARDPVQQAHDVGVIGVDALGIGGHVRAVVGDAHHGPSYYPLRHQLLCQGWEGLLVQEAHNPRGTL